MWNSLTQALRRSGPSQPSSDSTLPLYSPISAEIVSTSSPSPSCSSDNLPLSEVQLSSSTSSDLLLKPARRHATPSTWPGRRSVPRLLADFTLGFADGLTVPFALTAGLSSLGQTDTVIYAGMAELCAGSISMGVGGYLGAKAEAQSAAAAVGAGSGGDEDEAGLSDEKDGQVVDRYLAPLDLPRELLDMVRVHVKGRTDVAGSLAGMLAPGEEGNEEEDGPPPPVVSGISVALGYLIGGSLPLFPYFVVSRVGDGLLWSFIVCIIALFSFGFSKDFVLQMQNQREEVWIKDEGPGRESWRWAAVRRSSWEGTQMVILGSLAALAAVLCVRLFDGMGHDLPQP